jgi:hypothetical protein
VFRNAEGITPDSPEGSSDFVGYVSAFILPGVKSATRIRHPIDTAEGKFVWLFLNKRQLVIYW